jgi:hypothetical protein
MDSFMPVIEVSCYDLKETCKCHLFLKTLTVSPKAEPVINLVRAALVNFLKLCHASSKLQGYDLKIT